MKIYVLLVRTTRCPSFGKKLNLAINGFLLPFFNESSKPPKAKISIPCLCTTCNHHWVIAQELTCHNPTLKECEDNTHTPEMGTWESSGTPKNLELDCRGQNTSPWGVFYIVGKVLKRRCRKWPRMGHSDICSTSYVRNKGRESNWQLNSWPLKVGNRPDPGACRWSAAHRWKALKESYKFSSDLIQSEVWARSYELPNPWESKSG
jgi:hypothetical protein